MRDGLVGPGGGKVHQTPWGHLWVFRARVPHAPSSASFLSRVLQFQGQTLTLRHSLSGRKGSERCPRLLHFAEKETRAPRKTSLWLPRAACSENACCVPAPQKRGSPPGEASPRPALTAQRALARHLLPNSSSEAYHRTWPLDSPQRRYS